MSFWAATVITNLVTAVPVYGEKISFLLWGGFSVGERTLVRFFSFHYLFPFLILVFIILHVFSLHLIHSQSPMQLKSEGVKFFPFF